jgi:hypothetical protein
VILAGIVGAIAGFSLATAAYELWVLAPARREIENARRSIEALRPLVGSRPIRSDLSDSSPSLPL